MVSLEVVQESNARVATLPTGLIALFIGATSGIGQSALRQFAQNADSPRIYSVARPSSAAAHGELLDSLRQTNPSGTYTLITADHSLISEMDVVAAAVKQKETKLDLLVMSAGFIAFAGREDTREGLDPSMTTRYYARQRVAEQLLPLLNEAAAPRIVSVLAGGKEGPLNVQDLDLRDGASWTFWSSSVYSATMHTLGLERMARDNPRLSVVHWYPGPVETPGLERAREGGLSLPPVAMSQDEAGGRVLFLATSDRYAVKEGLVAVPEGLKVAKKSGGGIFLVNPQGERADNEEVLGELRGRNVGEAVWDFTQKVFDTVIAQTKTSRDDI